MIQDFNENTKDINEESNLICYDWIQTSGGQSGSPIFLQNLMDIQLKSHLAGVHTGGLKD